MTSETIFLLQSSLTQIKFSDKIYHRKLHQCESNESIFANFCSSADLRFRWNFGNLSDCTENLQMYRLSYHSFGFVLVILEVNEMFTILWCSESLIGFDDGRCGVITVKTFIPFTSIQKASVTPRQSPPTSIKIGTSRKVLKIFTRTKWKACSIVRFHEHRTINFHSAILNWKLSIYQQGPGRDIKVINTSDGSVTLQLFPGLPPTPPSTLHSLLIIDHWCYRRGRRGGEEGRW